jgi:hypothetical protein
VHRPALIALVAAAGIAGCRSDLRRNASPRQASAENDGWRRRFIVQRTNLGPTGRSTYVDLTPGTVRIYREGKTILTITVTDRTRTVDGVTTRVVEEREEKNGRPEEISQNYFAIDRVTGDVYYFGEDVDVFESGTVSGHPGAWLSGVNGAKFGLAVPSMPVVGDRFYQELAPGVAMDRVEIVGVDETIETPAGTFRNCLHVRETTPLESDVGHKWYAPGVGLIKDDDAALVSGSPSPIAPKP